MAEKLCNLRKHGGNSISIEWKIKCIKSQSIASNVTFTATLDGDGLYFFCSQNSGNALTNGQVYDVSSPLPNVGLLVGDWIVIDNGTVGRIQALRNPTINGSTLTWKNTGTSTALMDLFKIV